MAPAPVLQVFGQPTSTDVARVMACLFERDLHFELVRTDAITKRGLNLAASCFVDTRARRRRSLTALISRSWICIISLYELEFLRTRRLN